MSDWENRTWTNGERNLRYEIEMSYGIRMALELLDLCI
jgi:hypothetical protein